MSVIHPPTTSPPPPTPPRDNDPFRYGWRFVRRVGPDGREDLEQVPLTLEDVLHPQEGDVIPENSFQEEERRYLADILNLRLPRAEGHLVLSDCLVNWGVPGIGNHSPDVSVFSGIVRPPPEPIGIFDLAASGGRCRMALEIVSPDTRNNDVIYKFDEYHQGGVPLYVIIDQKREYGLRELRGYEHTPDGYALISLTAQSRLPLRTLGLELVLEDNRLVCYDAATGAKFGNYSQVFEACQTAEAQAQREAEARQTAEARLQELEAEVRRLRGQGPP
jgi:Uma2 family endonuclease